MAYITSIYKVSAYTEKPGNMNKSGFWYKKRVFNGIGMSVYGLFTL